MSDSLEVVSVPPGVAGSEKLAAWVDVPILSNGEVGLELLVKGELLWIHAGLSAEAMGSIDTEHLDHRRFASIVATWAISSCHSCSDSLVLWRALSHDLVPELVEQTSAVLVWEAWVFLLDQLADLARGLLFDHLRARKLADCVFAWEVFCLHCVFRTSLLARSLATHTLLVINAARMIEGAECRVSTPALWAVFRFSCKYHSGNGQGAKHGEDVWWLYAE